MNPVIKRAGVTSKPGFTVAMPGSVIQTSASCPCLSTYFTDLPITEVDSYQSAVALARETARPGDVVLLSPASTSFDRFANFMERGRVFKDLVNALK